MKDYKELLFENLAGQLHIWTHRIVTVCTIPEQAQARRVVDAGRGKDQFAFIVWPLLDHPSRKPNTQEDLSSTNCTCLTSKSLCRLELLSFCLYFLSSSVISTYYHSQPSWYSFAQENAYDHPRCPKWFPPLHIYNWHPLENSLGIPYYLKSLSTSPGNSLDPHHCSSSKCCVGD